MDEGEFWLEKFAVSVGLANFGSRDNKRKVGTLSESDQ